MILTLLKLFYEFFKIGLFSVGGGLATIPFLYDIINRQDWYTHEELANIIAVSMITPGPIGANMATYAGHSAAGTFGGIFATFALCLPSYCLVSCLAKLIKKYRDNFFIKTALYSLKPAGCGLLAAVAIKLCKENLTNMPSLLLVLGLFALTFKLKVNPLWYMFMAAIIGALLQFLNVGMA